MTKKCKDWSGSKICYRIHEKNPKKVLKKKGMLNAEGGIRKAEVGTSNVGFGIAACDEPAGTELTAEGLSRVDFGLIKCALATRQLGHRIAPLVSAQALSNQKSTEPFKTVNAF